MVGLRLQRELQAAIYYPELHRAEEETCVNRSSVGHHHQDELRQAIATYVVRAEVRRQRQRAAPRSTPTSPALRHCQAASTAGSTKQ